MKSPNKIHPKKFVINDMYFQVVSYAELSDSQAGKIAMNFYKTHKFKKKDKGKLFSVITTIDNEATSLF
ncbi:MAG: hypothetical protein DIZ78_09500 [endosymbiont of Escarpia spicata]|uniref:Uncharacterized protein n=1 Tax=endosymbiont of Escarpia spicata TaxID=2200908 RepID=A0A370DPT3_9GAMM|nr:MAG: hypothetical protein DIZ78_09500 [endosymbiont of Escarpia spicata]